MDWIVVGASRRAQTGRRCPCLCPLREGCLLACQYRVMAGQDDAIAHGTGPARLLAGPGTGKTTAIIGRIRHLVFDQGVDPKRILVITFSVATALDLSDRLRKLDPALPALPEVRTLHSYAFQVLRTRSGQEFVGAETIDEWEQRELVCADLARRVGRSPAQVAEVLHEYDAAWRTLEDPPPAPWRATFEGWVEKLRSVFHFAMLGELVYKLKQLLDGDPEFHPDFDYLLVDEYQDLNACDLSVIRELGKRAGGDPFVAGDDDQCIYRFRQADPDGIRNFHNDYPGASDYFLEDCYRCGRPILEAALRLIEHEPPGRIDKTLEPVSEEGEVHVYSLNSPQRSIKVVADLVSKHAGSVDLGQILILVPRRSFASQYVEELQSRGIDAVNLAEPKELLADCEARRVLYAVRYATNPEDAVALRGWLRCTPGIGPGAVANIIDRCLDAHVSFAGACAAVDSTAIKKAVAALEALAEQVRDKNSFEEVISEAAVTGEVTEASIERLRELAHGLHVEEDAPEEAVEQLEAQEQEEVTLPQEAPGVVRVTTLRKAKGLTAEVVIVTDLDDDIVPGNAEDLDEERRLIYVSMTRARRHLYLLHVIYRYFHSTGYAGSGTRAPGPYRQRSRDLNEVDIASEALPGSP